MKAIEKLLENEVPQESILLLNLFATVEGTLTILSFRPYHEVVESTPPLSLIFLGAAMRYGKAPRFSLVFVSKFLCRK